MKKSFLLFLMTMAWSSTAAQAIDPSSQQCGEIDDAISAAQSELRNLFSEQEAAQRDLGDRRNDFQRILEHLQDLSRSGELPALSRVTPLFDDYRVAQERLYVAQAAVDTIRRRVIAKIAALEAILELRGIFCGAGAVTGQGTDGDEPSGGDGDSGSSDDTGSGTGDGSSADGEACQWSDAARDRSFPGKSIQSVKNVSVDRCKAECESRQPECKSIVYDREGRWCYLRSEDGSDALRLRQNIDHYACRAGIPTLAPEIFVQLPPPDGVETEQMAGDVPACQWSEPQVNKTFDGKSLDSLRKVSVDQCKAACENNEDCQSIIYDVGGNWCYLRDSAVGLRSLRERQNLHYYVPQNCP